MHTELKYSTEINFTAVIRKTEIHIMLTENEITVLVVNVDKDTADTWRRRYESLPLDERMQTSRT